MAKGIQDLGNGFGFVYMTAPDGTTIQSVISNTNESVRSFRKNANLVAPLASNRSAFGVLTFTTGTAGTGSITAISVNGVDQIAAPFIVTGLSDADCAAAAAVQINSFTPGSGYDYFAVAVGASVYIFAPPSAGATPNGYAISVTDSGSVVTYTTQAFINGANAGGVYDTVSGSRFFLNADYGPNGISGELAAQMDVLDLPNSVEITKYLVMRGQQAGIFNKTITASSFTIAGVDRSGIMTKINVIPQSGSTQTVIKINTEDFQEGDLVFVQADDPADVITVESAPAVTVSGTGNIYLTSDLPWVSNRYTSLLLQYKFITGIGPSFVEMARSLATTNDTKLGNTLWVSSLGNDASGEKNNINKHFLTITAAKNAASSGDVIIVCPGTYTDEAIQKNGVNYHFMDGAIINASNTIFSPTSESFNVTGFGVFNNTGGGVIDGSFLSGSVIIRCKKILGSYPIVFNSTGNFELYVNEDIVSNSLFCLFLSGGNNSNVIVECRDIINTATSPGSYSQSLFQSVSNIFISSHYSRGYIKCNRITQTNGGFPSMVISQCVGGAFKIFSNAIINNFSAYELDAVLIQASTMSVYATLYCNALNSVVNGIFCFGISSANSNTIWFGDILTNFGIGLYARQGYVNFTLNGNIYSKTTNTVSWTTTPPAPAALMIGNAAAGVAPYQLRFIINGSINQFQPGSIPVFKAMQAKTIGDEVDHYLELPGSRLYTDDAVSPCIYAETPSTASNNTIVLPGSYANTAASGGGTYVGSLVVDPAVSSKNFIL